MKLNTANNIVSVKVATRMTENIDNYFLAESLINNCEEKNGIRLISIPLTLFKIDYGYQRSVDASHVRKLTPFNYIDGGVIFVSYRDGWFYIIDGQHRYHAALATEGIEYLNCIVITGLTSKQEASRFKSFNVKRNSLNPYAIFKSNVYSENMDDEEVVIDMFINDVCKAHNIEIKKFGRGESKTLRCLSRARIIVGHTCYDGRACFKWIIDFINTTDWADVSAAYTREVVLMLKNFWLDNRTNKELIKKLRDVLNTTTPTNMIIKAKHDYSDYGVEVAMGLVLRDMMNNYKSKVKLAAV